MDIPLDVLGSVLSFLGGAVLTLDAFLKRHDVLVKEGAKVVFDVLDNEAAGSLFTERNGTPLDTPTKVELRLARRSQQAAWIGFALVTAGFLVEVVDSLVKPSS